MFAIVRGYWRRYRPSSGAAEGSPFFIGWFLGGIPDVLAAIFGIVGTNQSNRLGGVGKAQAIVGLVLGGNNEAPTMGGKQMPDRDGGPC